VPPWARHITSACTSSAVIAEHALARYDAPVGQAGWPTPASFTTTAGRYPGGYLAVPASSSDVNAAGHEWPRQEMLRGS
jgi:hypothetical protein